MKQYLINNKMFRRCTTIITALLAILLCGSTLADSSKIRIDITGQQDDGKAYLTWAPVKATIRLKMPANADVAVILTNDEGSNQLTPIGKRIDGDLAFSGQKPAPGKTAADSMLRLTLPKNGQPVSFYLAGKFPQASTKDTDAIIEIRSLQDNQLLGSHATMVRVRKEFKTLTPWELSAFLTTLNKYQESSSQSNYLHTLDVHDWAGRGKFPSAPYPAFPNPPGAYRYPDQAHSGPAFLSWHRAYLLELERELQKINPTVTLHYWPSNLPNTQTKVFTTAALGDAIGGIGDVAVPTFDDGHPFEDWRMPNAENPRKFEPIQRYTWDPTSQYAANSDSRILRRNTFNRFTGPIESNPHNQGHNYTGPWMANCRVSPRDPVFWVFHSWFDKMWAQWQYKYNRFTKTVDDFSPIGKFVPGNNIAKGHFMDDTIWPWNGVIGQQPDELASRPPVNLSGPFKASGKKNIWPGQNTTIMPTNGDLIDYSATLPANMDMGFAYDTVPFGAQDNLPSELAMFSFDSKQSPNGGGTSTSQSKQQKHDTKLIKTYHSKAATQKSRQKALASMDIKYNQEHARIADNLISNPKANEAFRIIALSQLAQTDDPDAVKAAAKILMDDNDGGESLDVHAVHTLNYLRMFNKLDSQEKKLAHTALQDALNDDRTKVKAAALKVLSGSKSKMAIAKLQAHLRDKAKRVMDLPTTIHLLAGAAGESSYQHLRPFIKHANVDARVAAVTQLGSDKQSTQSITALLQDKNQPYKVRSAAAGSLLYHDKNFATVALALIKKSNTPNRLKQRLKRALRKHISELNPTQLSIAKRQEIRQTISQLSSRKRNSKHE